MHQLLIGPDTARRDKVIGGLKTRLLKTPDALKLDLSLIDAQGLDFNDLKAALLTVPAVAPRRLVVISRAEKLSDKNLEFIDHVSDDPQAGCVMALEAASWDRRSALRKRLAEKFEVSEPAPAEKIFDILRDLPHDRAGVLSRVKHLLEDGEAENILGAMRWWWVNKVRGTLGAEGYKKGLLVIQEADERVKLSGMLSREHAVEVALVKLSLLLRP